MAPHMVELLKHELGLRAAQDKYFIELDAGYGTWAG